MCVAWACVTGDDSYNLNNDTHDLECTLFSFLSVFLKLVMPRPHSEAEQSLHPHHEATDRNNMLNFSVIKVSMIASASSCLCILPT